MELKAYNNIRKQHEELQRGTMELMRENIDLTKELKTVRGMLNTMHNASASMIKDLEDQQHLIAQLKHTHTMQSTLIENLRNAYNKAAKKAAEENAKYYIQKADNRSLRIWNRVYFTLFCIASVFVGCLLFV